MLAHDSAWREHHLLKDESFCFLLKRFQQQLSGVSTVQLTKEQCFVNFWLGLSSVWQAVAWDGTVAAKEPLSSPVLWGKLTLEWAGDEPGAPSSSVTVVNPCLSSNCGLHCWSRSFILHVIPRRCVMYLMGWASRQPAVWAAQTLAQVSALWSREWDTGFHAADFQPEDNPHSFSFTVLHWHCFSQLPPDKFLISLGV